VGFLEHISAKVKFSGMVKVCGGEGGLKEIMLQKRLTLILLGFMACVLALNTVPNALAAPWIYSCNKTGTIKTVFGITESVYVIGWGFKSNETLTIYVVPNGAEYKSTNAIRSVTKNAEPNGTLLPTDLGTFGVGQYDIWVDRNGDGVRQTGELFEPVWLYLCNPGFFVVPEYWLGTILGLVGCFAALGMFRVSKKRHLQ
jgi:hypothetical protein